ncbi:MAG TPA: MBL fold metallo-hydrolase [Candidatus Paceibacterota bacterium]|nr:MBL fold metallo-hydrolase [Candidatus Paceibacterota bacterium]
MQIVWKGQACFFLAASRGKQEQVRIVIDPYEESIGLKPPQVEADMVLVTHDHFDHNNAKAVRGEPMVISGPGEYELKGVFIKGIASWHDNAEGKDRGKNTMYVIEAEGLRLCHLGDIGQDELSAEQVGQIGNVDILFIPVGGTYTVAAKGAAKIISQIEPRMVIPMHYALPRLKVKLEPVDEFLKTMGVKNVEPQAKLSLKAKDFSVEEMKVVVLTP